MYLQMASCACKTSARDADDLLTGEVTERNATSTTNLFKRLRCPLHLKTHGYYILCYQMEVESLFNM